MRQNGEETMKIYHRAAIAALAMSTTLASGAFAESHEMAISRSFRTSPTPRRAR